MCTWAHDISRERRLQVFVSFFTSLRSQSLRLFFPLPLAFLLCSRRQRDVANSVARRSVGEEGLPPQRGGLLSLLYLLAAPFFPLLSFASFFAGFFLVSAGSTALGADSRSRNACVVLSGPTCTVRNRASNHACAAHSLTIMAAVGSNSHPPCDTSPLVVFLSHTHLDGDGRRRRDGGVFR